MQTKNCLTACGGWLRGSTRQRREKFAGALQGQRARKGIFITTSAFSGEALGYVSMIDSKIILIDGTRLAKTDVRSRHRLVECINLRSEANRL